MPAKNDVWLTAADVERFKVEIEELDREIREKQELRASLDRKVRAAAEFAPPTTPALAAAPAPVRPKPAAIVNPSDDEEDSESTARAIYEHMLKTGASLNIRQIKALMIELGHGAKVAARPNYLYGLAYTLKKAGKLTKRGSKYRAVSKESSQEETGAVGAPVRQ